MVCMVAVSAGSHCKEIELRLIGNYRTGIFNQGAAEIVVHDPKTQRLFFVNGATASIDILEITDPSAPTFIESIELKAYGSHANSVAFQNGILAAAVEANTSTHPGAVAFFDAFGTCLNVVQVGALPDMLTFTPDGSKLLVANEGEPAEQADPEGSVSIIHLEKPVARLTQSDVITASFSPFNILPLDPTIHVFGPAGTASIDFEPEFIAVASDSRRAWVTLQENNAVAVIDLKAGLVQEVVGLTSHRGSSLGVSMFHPDAIAAFRMNGKDYLVTANEGEARGTALLPLRTGSFSIWSAGLDLVYDSGDQLEVIAAQAYAAGKVQNREAADPEGVVVGKVGGEIYAFIGLELLGGVVVYNITNPAVPCFVQYVNPRNFNGDPAMDTAGDLGPEGILFIPQEQSPINDPLLVVANEISGSISIYCIRR